MENFSDDIVGVAKLYFFNHEETNGQCKTHEQNQGKLFQNYCLKEPSNGRQVIVRSSKPIGQEHAHSKATEQFEIYFEFE
jgi:cellulase/cellobiase CelA1